MKDGTTAPTAQKVSSGRILRAQLPFILSAVTSSVVFAGPTARTHRDAVDLAQQRGWTVRREFPDGRIIELQRVVNGIPLYYTTQNLAAADTVSTDECWLGGSGSLELNGTGVRLGVWDGGAVRLSHDEFGGRAVQMDAAPFLSAHATHVTGTMAASGLFAPAKGMASGATLGCYDWNEDIDEIAFEAALGLRLSNHSYGYLTGWSFDPVGAEWYWYGDVTVSQTEDYFFGFYSPTAAEWDQLAFENPRLLFVKSAGNDRNDGPPAGSGHWVIDPVTSNWSWSTTARELDGNGGYDSLSHQSAAKNGLVVGAVFDILGGYDSPADVVVAGFSSWGPCDDGRIKPDLVANGIDVLSTSSSSDTAYSTLSGTSMASPSVTGSLALLIQHYRATHPSSSDPLSSTLKALVIHTASEAGPAPGPDYRFGWGLLNTLHAANVLSDDAASELIVTEHVLNQAQSIEMIATASAGSELRATIAWTDPAGSSPIPQVDPSTAALVNDLDLRVERVSDSSDTLPWTLNRTTPSNPAIRADNTVDNVEQVVVDSPVAENYRVLITHKGSLSDGTQAFGLIITGATALYFDCNSNGQADSIDIGTVSVDCNANAIPDECDIASGASADCNANSIPDDCEFSDCNQNCTADAQDLLLGNSQDCNVNNTPDECDIDHGLSVDCNTNDVPDECDISIESSLDCNENAIPDECDLESNESADCNGNSTPDECDIASQASPDCNANGIPDDCDLSNGAPDCNSNNIPDSCEFLDCNGNCIADSQDVLSASSLDCNLNSTPDECDIASGFSDNLNANGIPDDCENLLLPGYAAVLVAREGRPAPGMNGAFTSLITRPRVNNGKQIAFWADTSAGEAVYYWSAAQLELRARVASPIIGTQSLISDLHKEVDLNDSGTVTFSAELTGGLVRGIVASTSSDLILIVSHGDPLPGGGFLDFGHAAGTIQHGLSNDGAVYFRASLANAPNGIGQSGAILKYFDGNLAIIASSGTEYGPLGQFDTIQQGPWVFSDGVVLFRVGTEGIDRIIRLRDDVLEEVVRTGAFAAGTDGGFSRFDDRPWAAGHVETFFSAEVDGEPARGTFKQRLQGDTSPLILEGDQSSVEGTTFVNPREVSANPLGDVFLYAQLQPPQPAAGVFRFDQRTSIASSILLIGATAPAAALLAVDDVSPVVPNGVGDLAIVYKATDSERRLLLLDQRLLGDLDLDDDVDIVDYESFEECMEGPVTVVPAVCDQTDLDQDTDTDMDDFGIMQDAFVICEQNGIDCNGNGVGDSCELLGLVATDCDLNTILDECQIVEANATDCNSNWLPDACDIAAGSADFNDNALPDECEAFADCNFNDVGDPFDISLFGSEDCDADAIPDECELFAGQFLLLGLVTNATNTLYGFDPGSPSTLMPVASNVGHMLALADACTDAAYGITDSGELQRVLLEDGSQAVIGDTGLTGAIGAAHDCRAGVLYVTVYDDVGALYRVSIDSADADLIGSFSQEIAGLAYDSQADVLYGLMDGLVWTLDTETGWPTLLCDNVLFGQAHGLAHSDGMLYTTSSGTLYQIDPQVPGCNTVALGPLPIGINRAEGLAAVYETTDCNGNQIPDNCDIALGGSGDANENGIPDECEGDCNSNGIDDDDELVVAVQLQMFFSPFGAGHPAVYSLPSSPPAVSSSTVNYLFEATADLGSPEESVNVQLVGTGGFNNFGNLWGQFGINCDAASELRTLPSGNYNNIMRGSGATLTMAPTAPVDAFECSTSSLQVTVSYVGTNDCNNSGRLDSCDINFGHSDDCNTNGLPDECEVARGWSPDCNGNGILDECEEFADCNGNLVPDECDLDCNGNGVPDECDLAAGAPDCNENNVLDECETDCNDNDVPDECDIASGTSLDCNGTLKPDECDISDGDSNDTNTNGVPDECEYLQPLILWGDTGTKQVEYMWPNGTHRTLVTGSAEGVNGVVVDSLHKHVYWSQAAEGGVVGRADLNGDNVVVVRSGIGSNVSGIALDVAGGSIFVSRGLSGGGGVIYLMPLDGTSITPLIVGLDDPADLAVDSANGKLYWCENDLTIRRANLDGTAVQTIKAASGTVGGIALNPVDNQLYWTLVTGNQIRRSNLDGTMESLFANVSGWPTGITVDRPGGRVYWTDNNSNRIYRANLNGTGVVLFVQGGLDLPVTIAVYNP